jgi:MerR family transcriptional regulator, thiopeptide resistance regulator
MFTVGELAKLTGVTVRTLHHYDEIGLVRASQRTAAGYRLYVERDVLRLQQVLILRALGMSLESIAAALDDPAKQRAEILREQRALVLAQRGRLDAMLLAIDAALDLEGGAIMTEERVQNLFDGFEPAEYAEESEQRWGSTAAYRECARRTKGYTHEDWQRYRAEAEAIDARLVRFMLAGRRVEDADVQAAVEQHRLLIDRWFYPCSAELHKALGAMYVNDPRFSENLDKHGEGYATYLSEAIAVARR